MSRLFVCKEGVAAMPGEQRIGAVAIVIDSREDSASVVNSILSEYGAIIVGRMGIPYREKGISVISLIVNGTADEVGAMAGRLGGVAGVHVKSALTGVK
jgi:putative iron-only hydrogenase system regulator